LFYGLWPKAPSDYSQALNNAIVLAETHALLYTDTGDDLAQQYGEAVAAGLFLDLHVVKAALDTYTTTMDSRTVAAVFAAESASGAALSTANAIDELAATRCANLSTGEEKRNLLMKKQEASLRSVEAAIHAVESAYKACRSAYNATAFYDAMWQDFNHIVETNSDIIGTPRADDMFVLPDSFGPLWPYGPPNDWTEYKLGLKAVFNVKKEDKMTDNRGLRTYPTLKDQCHGHIEKMVRFFLGQGVPNMSLAAERWRGLLADEIWQQTERLALRLHDQAVKLRRVCSEQFIERGEHGRVVLVSVAPSRGDDHILRMLPNGDYCEFLREERRKFRGIPDWANREFVHWMFLWDDGGPDVHLLYQWSFNREFFRMAMQLKNAGNEQGHFMLTRLPLIMPEDIISERGRFISLYNSLFEEEFKLIDSRSR
jgi:hypothetical protein